MVSLKIGWATGALCAQAVRVGRRGPVEDAGASLVKASAPTTAVYPEFPPYAPLPLFDADLTPTTRTSVDATDRYPLLDPEIAKTRAVAEDLAWDARNEIRRNVPLDVNPYAPELSQAWQTQNLSTWVNDFTEQAIRATARAVRPVIEKSVQAIIQGEGVTPRIPSPLPSSSTEEASKAGTLSSAGAARTSAHSSGSSGTMGSTSKGSSSGSVIGSSASVGSGSAAGESQDVVQAADSPVVVVLRPAPQDVSAKLTRPVPGLEQYTAEDLFPGAPEQVAQLEAASLKTARASVEKSKELADYK